MKNTILDAEEKYILGSYDRGEWRPIKNPKAEIKKLREVARNTLLHLDSFAFQMHFNPFPVVSLDFYDTMLTTHEGGTPGTAEFL